MPHSLLTEKSNAEANPPPVLADPRDVFHANASHKAPGPTVVFSGIHSIIELLTMLRMLDAMVSPQFEAVDDPAIEVALELAYWFSVVAPSEPMLEM